MSSAKLRLFSLRFPSPYVEAAFWHDYTGRSVGLARVALLMGLGQFAMFGFLDKMMVPEAFAEVQRIRYIGCALVALVLAYTFAPSFRRTMQLALAVPPLVIGGSIVVMSVVGQEVSQYYDYYAGLLLVLIFVHVLLRLRFVIASAVGGLIIGAYTITEIALNTPTPYLLNNTSFLVSANMTGMIASYALEWYARQSFHSAREQARSNAELAGVLGGLRTAQARLIQQEKMASLGRLTSGVAHEIKNPLNFVNNFAALSVELVEELGEALGPAAGAEATGLLSDLRENVARIREHGERADGIVRGMLEHTGTAKRGAARLIDLNDLVGTQAALARDTFRHRNAGFDPAFCFNPEPELAAMAVVPQELGRVVAALVDNACHAVLQRMQTGAGGDGVAFVPAVTVRTHRAPDGGVRIEVADNGVGIAPEHRERVFEPFFTTRPAGSGTGLDLSLAYEFVTNGHGGTLSFTTHEGRGTTFVVTLPGVPVAPREPATSAPAVPAEAAVA